ncbi:phosphopantetheine-binding protein [Streptomyces canus]|uniref:phosphopantetheine-binding protein n=1 Tax=Streptomyces canus TaxID=58343 RepID=UPI002E2CBDCB|nr:phosphopantetheine-binding protein [Streptomyces canus]
MEAVPLTYESVVDRVRTGILTAKGVSPTGEEITDATMFWPTGNPDQPTLAFDSLDFLQLIVSLEEKYGWVIPDTEIDVNDCQTVGDLAQLVLKNVNGTS